jgi:hypothetical protein
VASEAENLQTAIDNVAAKLAEVTANPKPSYSIDGQSVSWGEYYRMLTGHLKELREAKIAADGPFERNVVGWS